MPYGYDVRRAVDYASPVQRNFAATTPSVSPATITGAANPTFGSSNINVTASARSSGPLGFGIPDLSYADPNMLKRLDISNLIYSVSAGGYLTQSEASNANSYYNKFGAGGGGDPLANRRAAAYYAYLGTLPTRPFGTPALNQLYASGQAPVSRGPSYNTTLSNFFNTQSPYITDLARQEGFSPTYQGPYAFG